MKKIDLIIGIIGIILAIIFLYAIFIVKPTVKVTFDSDGGTQLSAQKIILNNVLTPPENPQKEGYTFVEWQNNNVKYDFTKPVTKNLILKAVWQQDNQDNSKKAKK